MPLLDYHEPHGSANRLGSTLCHHQREVRGHRQIVHRFRWGGPALQGLQELGLEHLKHRHSSVGRRFPPQPRSKPYWLDGLSSSMVWRVGWYPSRAHMCSNSLLDGERAHIPVGFCPVPLREHGLCHWVDACRWRRRPRLNELLSC